MKIGLVGCGRWGRYILRDLKSMGHEVYVVARSSQSIHNAIELQADEIVDDVAGLREDLDGFVVASPTATHSHVVRELLSRHKPMFVEKPFCTDSQEAQRILEQSSCPIFVMHKWRYHPAIEMIKTYCESKELGELIQINTQRNQWGTPHKDVDTNWIHLPHDLSIIWHLLGYIPKPQSVTWIKDRSGATQGLMASLMSDVLCTLEHNIGYASKRRCLNVQFEGGVLQMHDPLADHILLRKGKPTEKKPISKISVSTEMPLFRELAAFVRFIQNDEEVLYTPLSEEIELIKTIEFLYAIAK